MKPDMYYESIQHLERRLSLDASHHDLIEIVPILSLVRIEKHLGQINAIGQDIWQALDQIHDSLQKIANK